MKKCFKCLKTKLLKSFYRHPEMADGHLNKCILCTRDDTRKYAAKKDPKKLREEKRLWASSPAGKRRLKNYLKKSGVKNKLRKSKLLWSKNNREKKRAHNLIAKAVFSGKLKRKPCAICGTEIKVQAHHENYNRPLKVLWLCPGHHAKRHRELRD